MLGAIMPAPLAMAADAGGVAAQRELHQHLLGLGVGGHDGARRLGPPPSQASAAAGRGIPARSLSMGRGTPMTPVEATTTSAGAQPRARADERRHLARVARGPRSPVAALAQPAFTTTARARPAAEVLARDQDRRGLRAVGGEDAGRGAGPSATSRARSGRPRLDPGGDRRRPEAERGGDAHRGRPFGSALFRASTAFTSTGRRSRVSARTRSGRPKSRMKPSASLWS